MPAHSEIFPWPSYYGHYDFFEARMTSHSRVISLERLGDGVYEILRTNGNPIKIFICDCYSFGVAEYMEVLNRIGHVDAIIINSNWCGYSLDVKHYCMECNVGVFNIGDFMAALNRRSVWTYLNSTEVEDFKKMGWIR